MGLGTDGREDVETSSGDAAEGSGECDDEDGCQGSGRSEDETGELIRPLHHSSKTTVSLCLLDPELPGETSVPCCLETQSHLLSRVCFRRSVASRYLPC